MGGLPWIKVWTAIGDHPKVQRLERELGTRDALGVVVRLWCWTADYCPTGDIPRDHAPAAARVAAGPLRLKPAAVLSAMVTSGLLDPTHDGFRVHDWHDMQTVHVEADEKRRAQARERQRNHRARRNAGDVTVTRDVTRDSVTEKEKEIEITTHTEGRASGEADRAAIEARTDHPPHPLLDQVVLALRAAGKKPLYPKPDKRAAVEAAITSAGVPLAVQRIVAAWAEGKPWLTYYLDTIAPPPPKPTAAKDPARGMAPVGTDWNARPSWESKS